MAAVQASRAKLFTVCIDHKSQTLHFMGRGIEDQRVKSQLRELSERLDEALRLVKTTTSSAAPATTTVSNENSKQYFRDIRNLASQKRPEMLTRKAMIIQMKEDREKEEIAAQQAIEEERRLEEERRAAEEKERLEQERLKREKENEEKEELKKRRKRAINLARDVLGADYKFSDDLTIEQIEELKEKHIKQAKYERAEKKKRVLQAREIDFQVRALREAEQPLLIESFERSVEQSNTEFVTEFEKFKSVSHKKFQKNIKVKAGLSKMKSLLDTFTDVLVGNRTDLEIRLARKRSKIRRAEGRQREELERVRKEEEEEERRRQEALKRAEEKTEGA